MINVPTFSAETYKVCVAAQMVLDGVNTAAINFFIAQIPHFINKGFLSGADMAQNAYMTKPGAARHIKTLEKRGYLIRLSPKKWKLNDAVIREPRLLYLMRTYDANKLTAA